MFRISFYVPGDEAGRVKEAMFAAGAGRIGPYECCSWEISGTGQFRPLEGSRPSIGTVGDLSRIEELKVEMVCDPGVLRDAIEALVESHPYEEPAYGFWEIRTAADFQ